MPGYGSLGIKSYSDFTTAPRNAATFSSPTTITYANSPDALTPFAQFGKHDHVMVYDITRAGPQYFPLMNTSVGNPDGYIQFRREYVQLSPDVERVAFVDPLLVNMSEMNVVHVNAQAAGVPGIIDVDTIREYSELAAQGWSIDYSTLQPAYSTPSPVAKWYQACFDANGVFTTTKNSQCKFSVLPADLKFLQNLQ